MEQLTGPQDIEFGDAPVEVERAPRPGVVLSVRLSPEAADLLEQIAEARHAPLTQVAKEALNEYLKAHAVPAPVGRP